MPHTFFLVLRRLRRPLITLIIVYAISTLGLTLIPGIDGEGQPWKMDFFHAFYFVSYMGSTIGFGEIPYPFTDGQRLWTLVSIYTTVTAWLYAIGSMISLLQQPSFRAALTRGSFFREVKRIRQPFYLICGFGDTGKALIAALSDYGHRCVTLDINQNRLNNLELLNLPNTVPSLCADTQNPEVLIDAGINNKRCKGLIALTDDDAVNLKIAITGKLLNQNLSITCRVEDDDMAANMDSFGTDHLVNPYTLFSDQLSQAFDAPSIHLLSQWLTDAPGASLSDPLFPPKGHWILCGYGRFGKALERVLLEAGNQVTIIEADPELTNAPESTIVGRGTEANTLEAGAIRSAVGLVAGTDHDANNLSIIMTAKMLNADLFIIGRQTQSVHEPLFSTVGAHIIANPTQIIAHDILSRVVTPLTAEFLRQIRSYDHAWASILVSRIAGVVSDEVPHIWQVRINRLDTPAVRALLRSGGRVTLREILEDTTHRYPTLRCLPLLIKRGDQWMVAPELSTPLEPHDRVLFCGDSSARHQLQNTLDHDSILHLARTGKSAPDGALWRWMVEYFGERKRARSKGNAA